MGYWLSKMFPSFFGKKDVRVLMVGLDAAGKTTILYKLKIGDVVTTVPTIGTIKVISSLPLRFQCRDTRVSRRLFYGLGRWRSGPDSGPLETLLLKHQRHHLCP